MVLRDSPASFLERWLEMRDRVRKIASRLALQEAQAVDVERVSQLLSENQVEHSSGCGTATVDGSYPVA